MRHAGDLKPSVWVPRSKPGQELATHTSRALVFPQRHPGFAESAGHTPAAAAGLRTASGLETAGLPWGRLSAVCAPASQTDSRLGPAPPRTVGRGADAALARSPRENSEDDLRAGLPAGVLPVRPGPAPSRAWWEPSRGRWGERGWDPPLHREGPVRLWRARDTTTRRPRQRSQGPGLASGAPGPSCGVFPGCPRRPPPGASAGRRGWGHSCQPAAWRRPGSSSRRLRGTDAQGRRAAQGAQPWQGAVSCHPGATALAATRPAGSIPALSPRQPRDSSLGARGWEGRRDRGSAGATARGGLGGVAGTAPPHPCWERWAPLPPGPPCPLRPLALPHRQSCGHSSVPWEARPRAI